MKTLKITLLLLAVVLLTVSGQKSDLVNPENETTIKKHHTTYDLLAHAKDKRKIGSQG